MGIVSANGFDLYAVHRLPVPRVLEEDTVEPPQALRHLRRLARYARQAVQRRAVPPFVAAVLPDPRRIPLLGLARRRQLAKRRGKGRQAQQSARL